MKLNVGCGSNILDGWENHDADLDIRKPLPFLGSSLDFVFAEHVVEHLNQQEAWVFFRESHRVLKKAGVLRITVPSIVQVWQHATREYLDLIKARGWGDGSIQSAVKHLVFLHGHKSMWTPELLITVLSAVGFRAHQERLYESFYPELRNVEGHWRQIGKGNNDLESFSIEGIKIQESTTPG